MQTQSRIILILTIFMLVGGVAAAETVKFKGGGGAEVEIIKWMENGILVRVKGGRISKSWQLYYVEIESIDGRVLESSKLYKAFMTKLSDVKAWIAALSKGFHDKKQSYDRDGNIIKNKMKLCENTKGAETIQTYDKDGNLEVEATCARGQEKARKLYRDGRVRSVLFFKNNEIVSVERYKETGERIHLGQMNKE